MSVCLSSGRDGPQFKGPPLLFLPPLLNVVSGLIQRSGSRKGLGLLVWLFLLFFFWCLVKVDEVNNKFPMEVLFLDPVSLRHAGGKWRDENCTLGYSEK